IGETDAGDSSRTDRGERRENPPRRGRPAAGLVQHPPGPPRALPAVPPPGDEGAGAAAGVRAAIPKGAHPPGDESEPGRADSGRASGSVLPPGPADAAVPSETARGGSQHASTELLQAGRPLHGLLAEYQPHLPPTLSWRTGSSKC